MREILCAVFMVIGGLFMLLAALGIVRMPDLFTRMQASTKAATLGVSCTLLASAVYFGELGITTRALATIVFFLITTPIAAHMIGRAAYFIGVPLWEGTIIDQLSGRYNPFTHLLEGPSKNSENVEPGSREH